MSVVFRAGYDCARSGSLVVGVTEVGGTARTGTVTLTGRYFSDVNLTTIYGLDDQGVSVASTLGYSAATTALQTALNAICPTVFTVTFSTTTRKFTILHSGAGGVLSVTLTFNAAAQRFFGFQSPASAQLSHVSGVCAFYVIVGTIGGVKDLVKPRELAEDLAVDLLGSDGSVEGLAQAGAVRSFEMTFPAEPAGKVWVADLVVADKDPWPWELAFRHCRNVEPFYVVDNSSPGGFLYVGKLRADACAFDPALLSEDYFAYADVKIAAHYLGSP